MHENLKPWESLCNSTRDIQSQCAALNNIISGCDIADTGTDLTNTGNIFLS